MRAEVGVGAQKGLPPIESKQSRNVTIILGRTPRRRAAQSAGRVGKDPLRRRGAADEERGRRNRPVGSSALRDGAGRRPEDAARPPGLTPATALAAAHANGRNVVKTFAKNRRKSLFDGRSCGQQRNLG